MNRPQYTELSAAAVMQGAPVPIKGIKRPDPNLAPVLTPEMKADMLTGVPGFSIPDEDRRAMELTITMQQQAQNPQTRTLIQRPAQPAPQRRFTLPPRNATRQPEDPSIVDLVCDLPIVTGIGALSAMALLERSEGAATGEDIIMALREDVCLSIERIEEEPDPDAMAAHMKALAASALAFCAYLDLLETVGNNNLTWIPKP